MDIDQEDVKMISALILGERDNLKYADKSKRYSRMKILNNTFLEWIFDIVANSKNSIDVDKMDYMTRDSYHLGLKDCNFDYRTLIREARVINDEVCYPAKVI